MVFFERDSGFDFWVWREDRGFMFPLTKWIRVLALGVVGSAWAGDGRPGFEAGSGFSYNSNLSNAQAWGDVRGDFFWLSEAGVDWKGVWARDWRWSAGVFGGLDVPFEYEAFRALRVGGRAGVTRRFGLGREAPAASVSLRFGREFFEDEEMTGWFLRPEVRYGHSLGGDWRAEVFYRFEADFARSELFSGTANEFGLLMKWEPEERWVFFAGYRLRAGDVVSWASVPRGAGWRRANAAMFEVADVVERGNTVFGGPMTAYRFEAWTQVPEAGVVFALTPDVSLELRGEYLHTWREAIAYDGFIVKGGLRAAF